MTFVLHERLAADTVPVAELPLCSARLMNDSRWPWLILVPRCAGAVELHTLEDADQIQLMREIAQASRALEAVYLPDKINVGALGNLVPQLHVHVIARTRDDEAWPGPVWGVGTAVAYGDALEATVTRLQTAFDEVCLHAD